MQNFCIVFHAEVDTFSVCGLKSKTVLSVGVKGKTYSDLAVNIDSMAVYGLKQQGILGALSPTDTKPVMLQQVIIGLRRLLTPFFMLSDMVNIL